MTDSQDSKLTPETAYELLAGRLSAAEAERIRRLCAEDPDAAGVLAEAEAVTEAMRPAADAPPAGSLDRIVAAHLARTGRPWRWWPAAAAALAAAAAVVLLLVLTRGQRAPQQSPQPQPQPGQQIVRQAPQTQPGQATLRDLIDEAGKNEGVRNAGQVVEGVGQQLARGGEAVTQFIQTVMAEVDFTTLFMDSDQTPRTETAPEGEGT